MKSRTFTCITAMTLFTALAIPVQLAAQGQPRYKLVDVGTFGGPNSFVNGPTVPILSNNGTYAGEAETSVPDPYTPNCQDRDCLVQHAQEWQDGVVTDLGTLPGVDLSSGATWVSANVVGWSENGEIDPVLGIPEIRAVRWTKDGQIIDLGTLGGGNASFATAVNNRGQVTGWSLNTIPDAFSMVGGTTQTRTFLWQQGLIQDLGTLGGPDALSEAMNERGQIVGTSYTSSTPNPDTGIPTIDPFLWENGSMVDLGTLGGTVGVANFVNNRGQAVGVMNLAGDLSAHPFFWDRGVLTDIGTFGGSNGEALWISNPGLAVGRADFPGDFIHHAFVWKNGVMTDVGVVPGDLCTNGRAINSRGQAVGTSTNCMGVVQHMFLWENGSIHDLTALILPGSDIAVEDVMDINDRGEIAAVGILVNEDVK